MYSQLSAKLKFKVTAHLLVIKSWMPLAIVCAVVDKLNGGPQLPDPPGVMLTEVQDTMTADTGTFGQLMKLAPLDCTVRLQFP